MFSARRALSCNRLRVLLRKVLLFKRDDGVRQKWILLFVEGKVQSQIAGRPRVCDSGLGVKGPAREGCQDRCLRLDKNLGSGTDEILWLKRDHLLSVEYWEKWEPGAI